MASASDAFNKLISSPRGRRLLEIARSDNPLIALGVTKREISWTQFLAWLLDPVRHPGLLGSRFVEALVEVASKAIENVHLEDVETIGKQHLATVRKLAGRKVARIRSVQAEVSEGSTGRSDLRIACEISRTRLNVLIENKIETQERKDQLRDYVKAELEDLPSGTVLLLVLMELGDGAIGLSSCRWAVCLGRNETTT